MNKERILFTGGTGFIGRNVLPIIRENYAIFSPRRDELNLFDENALKEFVTNNRIDYIIHSANPNPYKNELDKADRMLRESLQMFLAIYRCRTLVKKVVYMGSGAIYDKTKDIVSAREEEAVLSIPKDDYGFAKFLMQHFTHENVYNLCLFGCYGPSDDDTKFITHCIRCCLRNEPITIRQDCVFDYVHVYDLAKIISWVLSHEPRFNMYNVCSGSKKALSEIAQEVKRQMKSSSEIVLLKGGWNKEYTGSNERLMSEYHDGFIGLEEGISIQIKWEKANLGR